MPPHQDYGLGGLVRIAGGENSAAMRVIQNVEIVAAGKWRRRSPSSIAPDQDHSEEVSYHPGRSNSPLRARRSVATIQLRNDPHWQAGSSLSQSPGRHDRDPHHAVSPLTGAEQTISWPAQTTPPLPPEDPAQQPDGFFGESSMYDFVSRIRSSSPEARQVRDNGKRPRISSPYEFLMAGSLPTQPASTTTGSRELPQKELADRLVDAYFHRVHRLYPFIHEGTFRSDYEQMWARKSVASSRPSWLAILNMLFFYGWEFSDSPDTGQTDGAYAFVVRAQSLLFPEMLAEASLEVVQALLLVCHYLQGTLQVNRCWSLAGLMTHSAISIGLHLNPTAMSLTSLEKELRKRVWWGCILLGCTLGMKFGRPPLIKTGDGFLVDFPAEIDDQYISANSLAPRQPSGRPSLTSFFVHTIKMAPIIERILQELYLNGASRRSMRNLEVAAASSPTPAQILGSTVIIDGQLSDWWRTGPPHLTGEHQSDEDNGPEFLRQRLVLLTRYQHVRLLLHRQSFLIFSRQQVRDPFLQAVAAASAQICVSSARRSIKLICAPENRHKLNSLYYNLHYVFAATGVLLSLKTRDAAQLEAIGVTPGDEVLGLGMQFLRSAGQTVPLAARYHSMLRQIQSQIGRPEAGCASRLTTRAVTPDTTSANDQSEFQPGDSGDETAAVGDVYDMNGLFGVEWLDCNDLFMGAGI